MPTNKNISLLLVLTIALLSMAGPFSIDTYLPSFPDIEAEYGINRTLLLQSISFYLLASAFATLFWGPLSDRVGRRSVILGSLFVFLLASLGCAMAVDYHSFLLFRILQGVGASGGLVVGRAMVRDSHNSHDAHRVMAYIMMVFAVAPAIAPIIGGWLHYWLGWRSVFYFLALYAGLLFLIAAGSLRETLAVELRQSFQLISVLRVYARMLFSARFLLLVLALGSSFGGLFLYIAGSPTVIFNFLHLDSSDFALQFVPMTLGIIAGSFVSGRLAQHWKANKIITLAFLVMGSASISNLLQANLLPPSATSVIAPLSLYAFGLALAMPGFGILAIDCFPHNRGAASAVQSFVQVMSSAFVSGLVLPLLAATVWDFALAQSICLLVAAGLWWLLHRSFLIRLSTNHVH